MAPKGFHIVCLEPGTDNPKEHAPVPAPEPPEGFVDNTVYRYRIDEDGNKVLIGTMEAFPKGWDHLQQFREKGFKKQKEEVKMPKKDIDFEAIVAKAKQIMTEQDVSLYKASGIVAQETGLHRTTVYNHARAMLQAPSPEPAAAANQEPIQGIQGSQEPAEPSVSQLENEVKETYEDLAKQEREQGFGPEDNEPIPYTVVPKVWTEWDKEYVRKLKAEGLSMRQIAKETGFTLHQIRHFFEREAKKHRPQQNDVLTQYKVKWIRDVMLDDLDPGVQLRIVSVVQGLEI